MKIEAFQDKFGNWLEKLEPFIQSEKMDKIYSFLKEKAQKERILPESGDTFRAFRECRLENLRVVVWAQDPYANYVGKNPAADGLCFSNSKTGKLQPSLEKWYDGIQEDIYGGTSIIVSRLPDLSYLASQGVLLLNSSFTVSEGKIGSHRGLWDEFNKYLIEEVLNPIPGLVHLLVGTVAWELEKYIVPFGTHVFRCEHPSAAARENREWKHNRIFWATNVILRELGKGEIIWDMPF